MTASTDVPSINVNSVFNKKTVKEHIGQPLFNVGGYAEGIVHLNTKYGEQIGFKGDFVAVNLLTGEVFSSSAAFLPKGLAKDIERMLEKSENKEVRFNATIKAVKSDKNANGYAWIAEAPETEERANRRAQLMIDMVAMSPKLLEAPTKSGKKAA